MRNIVLMVKQIGCVLIRMTFKAHVLNHINHYNPRSLYKKKNEKRIIMTKHHITKQELTQKPTARNGRLDM